MITPTHTCFDDAPAYISWCVKESRPWKHLRIVHAICTIDSTPYAHAWVEDLRTDTAVIREQRGWVKPFVTLPLQAYRASLGIQHETRYALKPFLRLWRQHGYPGPWVPRYMALCEAYDTALRSEEALQEETP